MASINATTSSGIVATADNTGLLQLQSAGTTVMTITPTGVTTQVGAPAFRAYRNGNQTISATTTTKVAFNTENFDTNNNYDPTTNFRFTPTVAGYYQVNAVVGFTTGAGQLSLFKNGSNYQTGIEVSFNASLGGHIPINDLVYLNGSTDYIEIFVYLTSGTTITSGETNTSFSAFLARSA
jgi:hypothetical protein